MGSAQGRKGKKTAKEVRDQGERQDELRATERSSVGLAF